MQGTVEYCTTSDGVRIAYSVTGTGYPLLAIPGFLESFSLDSLVSFSRDFYAKLGTRRTLIRYDMRGTGLSERAIHDMSHAKQMLDLEAVVQALHLDHFSLWASTTAGPRAIEYAARYPDRVDRLVLYGTYARGIDVMPEHAVQALMTVSRANWEMGAQVIADMSGRRNYPELTVPFADMYVKSTSGEIAAMALEAFTSTDVSAMLKDIKASALVMHRRDDPIFPFALAQGLAAGIPGAQLVPLDGNMHAPQILDADSITDRVGAFLADLEEPSPEPVDEKDAGVTPFRAILFTDLVGHTQMMHRLGDDKGRDVLREHETITRRLLKENGGAEVKTMGDGFMASFPSVTKGVECAIALQRAFDKRNLSAAEPLNVRVGLNAGEPIEEDGDLFGETVIIAARIAAMAKGSEILCSLGVRELCGGKGFLFADRGEHAMRGFEDPVRVFEISWQG